MKNSVFWDVTPCVSCKDILFGGTYRLHKLVNAYVVPSSLILSILMMEAVYYFETSVFTGTTQRHIPEDGILPVTELFELEV
jgi:hypothetical protein